LTLLALSGMLNNRKSKLS